MSPAHASPLDRAYTRLDGKLPAAVGRGMRRLRRPGARWVRIPVGVLCIVASALWFLPVLGIWMLPLGLMFLAQDVPFLRAPMGRMILWLLDRWDGFMKHIARLRG